jgi:hypothetical protein
MLAGWVEVNTGGWFSCVPDPGFAGTDSFTYQASDGLLLSDLATGTENSIERGGRK